MGKMVVAVLDVEVLGAEQPVDLLPNTTYLVTIESEASAQEGVSDENYPLTEIAALSTDMGVTDLASRHDWYARGRLEDDIGGA